MRTGLLFLLFLTFGCEKQEIVELTSRSYLVNKMYADDGSLLYEKIWLPEQRQGFFTDAGFANGSGKAYSAFASVSDTIMVMYRNNEHGRYFRPMERVYEVNSIDENTLEICFDIPYFNDVTARFKYNRRFHYPMD